MKAFTTHTGRSAVLYKENIDTDQIISKEHLKSIKRTGFGPALFSGWRYLEDGSENKNFELNNEDYKNATILITGSNFACGSSREHAVWALLQYGFRVVIAPRIKTESKTIPAFADIFRINSTKNGLLLIELSESDTKELVALVEANPSLEMKIDLNNQTINFDKVTKNFKIDPTIKNRLLKGLDDIGITLAHEKEIVEFENTHDVCLSSNEN